MFAELLNDTLLQQSLGIIDGLFLLLLAISGNFIAETLGCQTQKLLTESIMAKQLMTFFIIFFTISYSNKDIDSPLSKLTKALLVYGFFLLFTKMNLTFTIATFLTLLALYIVGLYIDYYKRIEAIQFSMEHDDGMRTEDIKNADIILLGVSRTSKTPTAIYLANRGFKTLNIPLVTGCEVPSVLKNESKNLCVIGLTVEPGRLSDIRSNRLEMMKAVNIPNYSSLDFIKKEIENSKNLFNKYNWPIIDVTRKSVEETAASIIRIYDIKKKNKQ